MTNCFHYNQPAIARVGAKQKLCALSSPLVKERLWAWDFNNESRWGHLAGLAKLPPFSSSTQVCTHCTKERGTLSAACTPGPQLAAMARWLGHRVVLLSFRQGTSSGPWVGLRGTVEAWLPVSLSSEPGLTLGVHLCLLAMNSGETV